jgi:hypothetical protein
MTLFRADRPGWLFIAIALPLYAFLYDNATSMPMAMGYGWTRLTPLPRQVRVAEIAIIAGLLGVALTYGMSRTTRGLMMGTLIFIGLGLTSFLRSADVPLLDGVRLIYMWVLPVFLFVIGREAPWGVQAWKRIATTAFLWVLLCAAVSWVQYVWLRYPAGDDITGLNKDAHVNGTLFMLTALLLLALGMFYERRSAWLGAALLLVTMVFSSVLKVMFLGVVGLSLLVWLYLRLSVARSGGIVPRGLKWGMAIVMAVGIVALAFSQIDIISSDRLGDLGEKVRSDPESLGPFRAHQVALTKIGRDLPTLALGMGPYRFANPISVGQVLDAGRLSRSASGEVLAIQDETGESTRITLTSSLLGEFGLPAFVVVVLMYVGIGRALSRSMSNPRLDIRARAVGLVASGSILAMIPLASLFGSLDVISVSWPFMLLAGVICREHALSGAA